MDFKLLTARPVLIQADPWPICRSIPKILMDGGKMTQGVKAARGLLGQDRITDLVTLTLK